MLSWSSYQDGTRQHPWIVMVNIMQPESHWEFDVQFVLNIKFGKYHRNGFHIRLSCKLQDYDKYEATIPIPVGGSSNYAVEYQKCLVLIQGPSRSAWLVDLDAYHATGKTKVSDDSDATKLANSATQFAIKKDAEQMDCFWILVFPPDIALDNQIFFHRGPRASYQDEPDH